MYRTNCENDASHLSRLFNFSLRRNIKQLSKLFIAIRNSNNNLQLREICVLIVSCVTYSQTHIGINS